MSEEDFYGLLDSSTLSETSKEADFYNLAEKAQGLRLDRIPKKGSVESKIPAMKKHLGRAGKVVGSEILGLPGDVFSNLTRGVNWIAEKTPFGKPKSEEELEKITNHPFTSESIKKKFEEFFPSTIPETDEQKKEEEFLGLMTGLLVPLPGPKKAQKINELYKFGKELNLGEKVLAPFKHGKFTEKALTQMAKTSEKAFEKTKALRSLAGQKYQELNAKGAALGPLNPIVRNGVSRGFNDIIRQINKGGALSTESKSVVKFLREAQAHVINNPNYSAEDLQHLYKTIGKGVNWDSLKQANKGHLIKESQNVIERGIYGMSPKLGDEFYKMNKMYEGYSKLLRKISPRNIVKYANYGGPAGVVLYSVMTGKDVTGTLKNLAAYGLTKAAVSRISTNLLTNPKWADALNKSVSILKSGSKDAMKKFLLYLARKDQEEDSSSKE